MPKYIIYELKAIENLKLAMTNMQIDSQESKDNMQKMLDMFEDNDDVQNVWHNWEME